MEKKYKFSVIMPIYNSEEYFKDSVNSVINQTIGFDNIELIVVNDGSTDNIEERCLKLKEKYPNIVYVKQNNKGASAARNKGLSLASGEYVCFLDADDAWNTETFKYVYEIKDDIIVVNKARYLKKNKYIKKFDPEKTNIQEGKVSIDKKWNQAFNIVNNVFIKTKLAKKYKFNENLKYYEGLEYVNRIILDAKEYTNCAYGAYLIRYRDQKDSLMDKAKNDENYYLPTIKNSIEYLINISKKKSKKVSKFIQYLIVDNVNERSLVVANKDKVDVKKYINKLKELLNEVEEDVFEKYLEELLANKLYLIELKNETDKLKYKDGSFFLNDKVVLSLEKELFEISIFEYRHKKLYIAGKLKRIDDDKKYKTYLKVNDKKYYLKTFPLSQPYCVTNDVEGNRLLSDYGFEIYLDIKPGDVIEAYTSYQGNDEIGLSIVHEKHSKFNFLKNSHFAYDGLLFTKDDKHIYVKKYNLFKKQALEIKYDFELLKNHQLKVFGCRMLYYMAKLFKRKDIWLVQEKTDAANDNAYHLFKYIMKQKDKSYKAYFVINKKSKDYKMMKQYGPVIGHYSVKHLIYFLLSDKIISSQANGAVDNIFGSYKKYLRDLYNFQFVFLQHGVTKDDNSLFFNKFYRNFKIFVTVANPEYKSILYYDYYYGPDVVKCTGFPRYDNLVDESKKQIVILPTWRKFLTGPIDPFTRIYAVNSHFKDSDFYKFYNKLINDEKLLNKMREKGYTGIFGLHPYLMSNNIYFKDNDVFKIERGYTDYGKVFKEGSLLITDYSSVPFDFAYLKKPVLYTQIDREFFFNNHAYVEGYYDYKRDGFGPVCEDYETTVNEIIKLLDNDCKLEKTYEKRIDKFFMHNDRNNCKRVYEEIKKL